jgi:hypothetical protein
MAYYYAVAKSFKIVPKCKRCRVESITSVLNWNDVELFQSTFIKRKALVQVTNDNVVAVGPYAE